MRRLIRGILKPNTLTPFLLLIASFLVSVTYIPKDINSIIINSIVIGIWVIIVRRYGEVAWNLLREEKEQEEEPVVLGILLLFTCFAMSRIWSTVYIVMDRPAWMESHWFPQFFFTAAAVSGYWFLNVRGTNKIKCGYPVWAMLISLIIVTGVLAYTHLRNIDILVLFGVQ